LRQGQKNKKIAMTGKSDSPVCTKHPNSDSFGDGGTINTTTPSMASISGDAKKEEQELVPPPFGGQIDISGTSSENMKTLDDELREVTSSLNDVKVLLEISKLEAETEAKAIAADVAIQKAKLALLEVYALQEEEEEEDANNFNNNNKDLKNSTQKNITESIAHTIAVAEEQTVSERMEDETPGDSVVNAASQETDQREENNTEDIENTIMPNEKVTNDEAVQTIGEPPCVTRTPDSVTNGTENKQASASTQVISSAINNAKCVTVDPSSNISIPPKDTGDMQVEPPSVSRTPDGISNGTENKQASASTQVSSSTTNNAKCVTVDPSSNVSIPPEETGDMHVISSSANVTNIGAVKSHELLEKPLFESGMKEERSNSNNGKSAKSPKHEKMDADETLELLCTRIEECRAKLMDPGASIHDQTGAAVLMEQYAKSAIAIKKILEVQCN